MTQNIGAGILNREPLPVPARREGREPGTSFREKSGNGREPGSQFSNMTGNAGIGREPGPASRRTLVMSINYVKMLRQVKVHLGKSFFANSKCYILIGLYCCAECNWHHFFNFAVFYAAKCKCCVTSDSLLSKQQS